MLVSKGLNVLFSGALGLCDKNSAGTEKVKTCVLNYTAEL